MSAAEVAFLRAELARVTNERDAAREELTHIKTVEVQKLREQIDKLRAMKDKFLAEVLEMKKTMTLYQQQQREKGSTISSLNSRSTTVGSLAEARNAVSSSQILLPLPGSPRFSPSLSSSGVLSPRRDAATCAKAAAAGQLDKLQLARAAGYTWDELTCTNAAHGGHVEILKWARSNGCPWNSMAAAYAAAGGHLEVLKWMRANGAPWDELTTLNAARFGHLDVLKWAREQGCPWSSATTSAAMNHGKRDVYEWLLKNGCPDIDTGGDL